MAETPSTRVGSRAAYAGLLFCALYITIFVVLTKVPGPNATSEDAAAFYSSASDRRWVNAAGVYLVPLAGISLLWFTAAMRHRVASLAPREDELLSTVQLLSAAVYVSMVFAATAVLTALAIGVELGATSIETAAGERSLLVVGDSILVVYALRAAGVFIAAGTTRAVRSGLIPRWFAAISYAIVVVLLLTVARVRIVTLLFPIWVAVMSIIVLVKRPADRHADIA